MQLGQDVTTSVVECDGTSSFVVWNIVICGQVMSKLQIEAELTLWYVTRLSSVQASVGRLANDFIR